MRHPDLEADYVIVGAGATGLSFADAMLTSSDASMILIDRRHKPGGHWNDAYPFVRLHSPSATYGVDSTPLGEDSVDADEPASGFGERASAAEICAYFDRVLHRRLLASGRVTFLPLSDYADGGEVTSLVNGARRTVRARRRVVDATLAGTRVPATHPPEFLVDSEAWCVSPDELLRIARPVGGYVVIGAGKTAMDTVVWLQRQGVDPDSIAWVRPRDPWLLNRGRLQPSLPFFGSTLGGFAAEMEAARDADSIDELFARLEALGQVRRIDPSVAPTMFRCAIVSDDELELLRRVKRVIRLGHVRAITADRIVLDGGTVPTGPDIVHVHCTTDGIPKIQPRPVFAPGHIAIQYVRRCAPVLSAALIAKVEALPENDAFKNELCAPVTLPNVPLDWLRMAVQEAQNAAAWRRVPALKVWLAESRLNGYATLAERGMQVPTPEREALVERYSKARQSGLARLAQLLMEHPPAASTRDRREAEEALT
ncbi:MAG: NAD(P)-binding protein [Burkholderiales bacterium]